MSCSTQISTLLQVGNIREIVAQRDARFTKYSRYQIGPAGRELLATLSIKTRLLCFIFDRALLVGAMRRAVEKDGKIRLNKLMSTTEPDSEIGTTH
jgi:hypothetical protein